MLPDINLFHFTLPVALLFVGDWMTPTPSHRAHPFHRGGGLSLFYLYPKSILLSLRYLIWSSFQIYDLNFHSCNLFQHTCLSCLKSTFFILLQHTSTFFILSYQLHCCWLEVGWPPPLPRAHPFHRGEGGLMGYDNDHGRGGGGGTRNLEHIYIYTVYTYIYIYIPVH